MATTKWTDARLERLGPGEYVVDAGLRGQGSLVLRVTDSTRAFYYRYFHESARRFELIGHHSKDGTRSWNIRDKGGVLALAAAKAGFAQLSALQNRAGNLKQHFEAEKREKAAAARQAETEARAGTFADLLSAYVESVKPRPSWREIDAIFKRHVRKPFAKLLALRANEITPLDGQEILGKMHSAGLRRRVNIARSYLRAAYQWASDQDYSPSRATEKRFNLSSNPFALVPVSRKVDADGNDAYAPMRNRALDASELRAYRDAVAEIADPVMKAFLTFHLYAAGQRIAQVLRAEWSKYEMAGEQMVLTVTDTKGRGGVRLHTIPVTPQAKVALDAVRPISGAYGWPFARVKRAPMHPSECSRTVTEISAQLVKARKVTEGFQLRDIRRSAKTAMASLHVSDEVRNRTQGHVAGKIERTYNVHSYLTEKTEALLAWASYIDNATADKVVLMRKR